MLDITTFSNLSGGNVLYKALAHPAAAEMVAGLVARLPGPQVVVDTGDVTGALFALQPSLRDVEAVYVQDVQAIGRDIAGRKARPLTELPNAHAGSVLLAAFDAGRTAERLRSLLPPGAVLATLDDARLPDRLLTNTRRYLDPLNFATNFAFFREEAGLSTRLVTANYWVGYGGRGLRLWLRLFDRDGGVLATWEEVLPDGGQSGVSIDSAEVRARSGLPEFTGQLFVHVIGATGHDVVKYALDTYGAGNDASLSCTHDANAWPSDRYAGIPAPDTGERVILWLQNSHATPIPAGTVSFDRMGAERPAFLQQDLGPFATLPIDVADLLPDAHWPAQIELRCGRHVVRPRYEVVREGRTRIAHANVERADLKPDPTIPNLPPQLGRGYLLPVPVLPRNRFRTLIQPTPMAEAQTSLPVRLDVFAANGARVAQHFVGCLRRDHNVAVDLDQIVSPDALSDGGHADLVYDFREGGEADGWLHTLVRAEDRFSGHVAESSFGAHIFNTLMTYRDEPQSYAGPPPGLSTRLFLRLGEGKYRAFTVLIYPASAPWHPHSDTVLQLHDGGGAKIAEARLVIACSGSALVFADAYFSAEQLEAVGSRGYVLVRDTTCRLFGYHGLMDDSGRFSLDHMFGF